MNGATRSGLIDQYRDFAALAEIEREDVDYRIRVQRRHLSALAVIAPHGGSIERRTSAIATQLAGDDTNLYLFEGLDSAGSFETLHITSHRFDEPRCLALITPCEQVVAIHGCAGDEHRLMIGGRDRDLGRCIAAALGDLPLTVLTDNHNYPGKHPANICNRGKAGRGVQLEFSDSLRGSEIEANVITRIRNALCLP